MKRGKKNGKNMTLPVKQSSYSRKRFDESIQISFCIFEINVYLLFEGVFCSVFVVVVSLLLWLSFGLALGTQNKSIQLQMSETFTKRILKTKQNPTKYIIGKMAKSDDWGNHEKCTMGALDKCEGILFLF